MVKRMSVHYFESLRAVPQGASVVGMNDLRVSTGNASRFNAIKHGLTAKTPVLPGEDPAELQAKIDAYKTSQQTRNVAEGDLATLAAMAYWRAMRANRLEVNRVTGDMVRQSRAVALREADEAMRLGERLLFDRRGPEQLYPSRDYEHKQPRTSWAGEADDPNNPGRLVLQLSATRAGRQWLRERLDEVRKPIDSGQGWVSCNKLKAIRLLGKQPLDAISDDEVALIFLASHAMRPVFPSAFRELRCEIYYDRVKLHERQLTRPELRAMTPPDAAAERAALLAIIDKAIERLWRLEAEQAEADEILELAESNVVSDEEAKNVAQVQRHLESSNRLVVRNLDTIKRWHRWEEEAWGRARRERERLKADARRGIMHDERFVIDERGTYHDAQGYDGDVEAGLARWEAAHGPHPCEKPYYRAASAGGVSYTDGRGSDVGAKAGGWQSQGHAEAITDRACEMAAGNGNGQGVPGANGAEAVADDGAVNRNAEGAAQMRDGATNLGQAGLSVPVPVILTGQGPAANIQNELLCQSSVMSGQLSAEGVGGRLVGGDDLGACEPGGSDLGHGGGQEQPCGRGEMRDGATDLEQSRLIDSVPLTPAGQEPATNIQNEVVGDEPSQIVGDGPSENLEAGQQEGGETGCQTDDAGGDLRASLPEEDCVWQPRAPELVSKRARRRRKREMARKEFERRRGVIPSEPNVSMGEMLDSVQWILPNTVAFLRKHGPRSL